MKTFKITVSDSFDAMQYEADIKARNEVSARKEALQYYAYELDTTADHLRIVGCVELLTA